MIVLILRVLGLIRCKIGWVGFSGGVICGVEVVGVRGGGNGGGFIMCFIVKGQCNIRSFIFFFEQIIGKLQPYSMLALTFPSISKS